MFKSLVLSLVNIQTSKVKFYRNNANNFELFKQKLIFNL